ncbi:MAG TPA: DoxX family protein, partial [bacterium]|nr:DoxX family protein [bacterium]
MAMSTEEMKAKYMPMAKVFYWIETLLVVSAMGSGGVMMLLQTPANVQGITALGYPAYLCTILGVAKILGCIAVLFGSKKFRTLKEWAYAGFTFDLLGAS